MSTPVDTSLKRTPLFDEHVKLGAKMVPFGGWEMPLQYEGILAEHEDTRKRVAVFDTCHMGEFLIHGDAVASGLDILVTQTVADMPDKTCRYGCLLNAAGGVMDDLIVYRLSEERWMIVVNGATTEKDAEQFKRFIQPRQNFKNISFQTGKLDIQGPGARDLLKGMVKGIEKLEYYTFDEFDVLGQKVIVSRTGYTGELGYEIYFPWGRTPELWREILKKGAKPAGLGVRDVLRIEMGYSLYGHELEEDISPLEAGLDKFIDLHKDFVGRLAILKQKEAGVSRKIVCFVSDSRRSPRAEHRIFASDGTEKGVVTSGTFSPSLGKGIGLGFIDINAAKVGEKIFFGNEKDKLSATIAKRPAYTDSSLKK